MLLDLGVFYQIDHRLIAVAMLATLLVAAEIGYRLGSAQGDAPDSLRSLMSGTGAATLGLLGLLGLTVLIGHVLAAVVRHGRPRDLTALLIAPFYVIWKLTIVRDLIRAARPDAAWVRTARTAHTGEAR